MWRVSATPGLAWCTLLIGVGELLKPKEERHDADSNANWTQDWRKTKLCASAKQHSTTILPTIVVTDLWHSTKILVAKYYSGETSVNQRMKHIVEDRTNNKNHKPQPRMRFTILCALFQIVELIIALAVSMEITEELVPNLITRSHMKYSSIYLPTW